MKNASFFFTLAFKYLWKSLQTRRQKRKLRVIKSMLQGVAAQLNEAGRALKSVVTKIIMLIIKILEQIPLLPVATEG